MSELSNCCDAPRWLDTDICSECKEHADFKDNDPPDEPDPDDKLKHTAYWGRSKYDD